MKQKLLTYRKTLKIILNKHLHIIKKKKKVSEKTTEKIMCEHLSSYQWERELKHKLDISLTPNMETSKSFFK